MYYPYTHVQYLGICVCLCVGIVYQQLAKVFTDFMYSVINLTGDFYASDASQGCCFHQHHAS